MIHVPLQHVHLGSPGVWRPCLKDAEDKGVGVQHWERDSLDQFGHLTRVFYPGGTHHCLIEPSTVTGDKFNPINHQSEIALLSRKGVKLRCIQRVYTAQEAPCE